MGWFGVYLFIDNIDLLINKFSFENIGSLGIVINALVGSSIGAFTLILVLITFLVQRKETNNQKKENKITRAYDLLYKEIELIHKSFDIFKSNYAFINYENEHIEKIISVMNQHLKNYKTKILKDKSEGDSSTFTNMSKDALYNLLVNLTKRKKNIDVITRSIDNVNFKEIVKNNIPEGFDKLLVDFLNLIRMKDKEGNLKFQSRKEFFNIEEEEISKFEELYSNYEELIDED